MTSSGIDVLVDDADVAQLFERRKEDDTVHGTQPGDPVRAAAAIMTAVGGVLDAQRAELEAWRELSAGTDFDA